MVSLSKNNVSLSIDEKVPQGRICMEDYWACKEKLLIYMIMINHGETMACDMSR